MKAQLIKPILMLTGAFLALSVSTVQAAFIEVSPPTSPIEVTYTVTQPNGKTKDIEVSIEYSPDATKVWYTSDANGDVGNQNIDNVGNAIENFLGLSTDALTSLEQGDFNGGNGPVEIIPNITFNFIAIHLGPHEFVFYYDPSLLANGQVAFTITETNGNGMGLSNFRTYSGPSLEPGPVVPVPAALWLFGSGLLGLIGLGSRGTTLAA